MDTLDCSWVGATVSCSVLSTVCDIQCSSKKSLNKLMCSHILSCFILNTALAFSADISRYKTNKQNQKRNKNKTQLSQI